MAGIARYVQHLVKVDATVVDQLIGAPGCTPNNDVRTLRPLHLVEPSVFVKMGSEPVFRFETTKIGTVLGAIGITGVNCATGFEIGYAERDAAAEILSTGDKIAATKCFVIPESIRAAIGEYASISYIGHAYSSDGATAPLTAAATLPAGTPAVAELFIPGTVTVNGTPIGKVLGFSIDFGIAIQRYKADGKLYSSEVAVITRNPVVDIEVADMGELSTADLAGAEQTDIVCNLIKLGVAGEGLAGAGNKTLTMNKSFLEISQTRGAVHGDCGLTFRATVRKGTGAIIIVG